MENKPIKRGGPYTGSQQRYIRDHFRIHTPEAIGKELGLNPKGIKAYIKKNLGGSKVRKLDIDLDITAREYWPEIKAQYTKDELKTFIFHWNNIIAQFQQDVLHTEEFQIIDVIRVEIAIDRCQKHEKEILDQIQAYQSELAELKQQEEPSDEMELAKFQNKCMQLERQLAIAQEQRANCASQVIEHLKLKKELLNKLRALRSDRVQAVEANRGTFSDLIRKLNEDIKYRQNIGREIEKIRLASCLEFERLTALHTYQDGELDSPILNSETVMFDENIKPSMDYKEITPELSE